MIRKLLWTLPVFAMMLAFGLTAQAHCGACGMGDGHGHKKDKDKDKAALNQPAPDFKLKDVQTGEAWTLSENTDGKITVLVFQSINCPWDRMRKDGGYQRYLTPLADEYADEDVQFIAINSNVTESDADVKAYADKHDIGYPILRDEENKVADMYNAKTTPHIFIINESGELVYQGGVEKAPSAPSQCGQMDEKYLEPVLEAMINDKPLPYTDTRSKGCGIKRG